MIYSNSTSRTCHRHIMDASGPLYHTNLPGSVYYIVLEISAYYNLCDKVQPTMQQHMLRSTCTDSMQCLGSRSLQYLSWIVVVIHSNPHEHLATIGKAAGPRWQCTMAAIYSWEQGVYGYKSALDSQHQIFFLSLPSGNSLDEAKCSQCHKRRPYNTCVGAGRCRSSGSHLHAEHS